MKRIYLILSLVATVVILLLSVYLYARLPEQIPMHWNIHGKVDGYGSKPWAVFLLPGTMIFLLVLFRLLSWLSPRHFEVDTFRPTFDFVMFMIVSLIGYLQILTLWSALKGSADMGRFFLAGFFLFFAALGNVLGKVRRNFWLGVRTPWTLASERVWNDTHRFAARLFVLVGVVGFLLTIVGSSPMVAFILIMCAAFGSVLYSLIDYKKLEKRGEV